MKNSTKLSIAAAALSGLLMGTAARASTSSIPVQSPTKKATMQKSTIDAGQKALKLDDKDKEKDKHDCKGKNDCKGKGGCKTGDNGCKGKNTCKGKGGCKTNEEKKEDKSVVVSLRL
jgi:hypothetical protein